MQSYTLQAEHMVKMIPPVTESGGLASRQEKANKEDRWVETKVCFILDVHNLGMGRADACLKADFLLPPPQSWDKSFIDRVRGLHAETVQSAQTVTLELVTGGLTSVTYQDDSALSVCSVLSRLSTLAVPFWEVGKALQRGRASSQGRDGHTSRV